MDFNKLVTKVHEVANEKVPTYLVVKDMFDTIDIRKDGIIDLHEWQQSFGRVADDPNKLAVVSSTLGNWENSKDFEKIGSLIAKNRKMLIEAFKKVITTDSTVFTYAQGKQALDSWLYSHFKDSITDDKLKAILRPATVPSQS